MIRNFFNAIFMAFLLLCLVITAFNMWVCVGIIIVPGTWILNRGSLWDIVKEWTGFCFRFEFLGG